MTPIKKGIIMDNSRNSNFTYEEYRIMIKELKENGYIFAGFDEAELLLREKSPFALMRHDVDMDLALAIDMAKIEANAGISSTFFFLFRTEHYNMFSKEGSKTINEILKLGHDLGLHFDCSSYPENASEAELSEACSKESEMLENWFSRPVKIVSFHRPNETVLKGSPALSAPRKHTYMPLYTKDIKYVSDSTGKWRYGFPTKIEEFRNKKPLHILTHPIWWKEEPLSEHKALDDWIDKKNSELKVSLAANCSVFQNRHL